MILYIYIYFIYIYIYLFYIYFIFWWICIRAFSVSFKAELILMHLRYFHLNLQLKQLFLSLWLYLQIILHWNFCFFIWNRMHNYFYLQLSVLKHTLRSFWFLVLFIIYMCINIFCFDLHNIKSPISNENLIFNFLYSLDTLYKI